ncbi:unnamed protein product [Zymoseptoria tritici ST99CH_3D1]|nr:unnamed protein product [Zymoseptoria tritici ST99CH_3D1]
MSSQSSSSNTTILLSQPWDVLIIGTGAAALISALSALTSTTPPPRVLLLDKAPQTWAGGNGYFTAAAYRTRHNGLSELLPLVSNVPSELAEKVDLPPYTADQFHEDLQRVTDGRSSAELGKVLVDESLELVKWLKKLDAVEWWLSFRRQAYEVDGRWTFWGGLCLTVPEGGKGLIRGLLKAVEERGGVICYEVDVKDVVVAEQGGVSGVNVEFEGQMRKVEARSVIMCAGGFEANAELRKKWMGQGWELAHTRGTPYNTGDMLTAAIGLGAKTVGDFSSSGCHSVAWDADSPKTGGDREKTNEFTKSGYPLGVMVNREGKRFVDEGIDLRNYTYAKFGRAILEQPGGIAYQIWDADGQGWLRQEEYGDEIVRKIRAESIGELAQKMAADENGLTNAEECVKTMTEYNEAVAAHRSENPDVHLNPAVKDGLSTQSSRKSLTLAKSNWAMPIVKPPFLAVKVTSGITFTFGGLAIDPDTSLVLREDGSPIKGLYCAGEMVGGLFYGNYPGGSGLTAGGVFGRRAGREAALPTARPARKAPKCHAATPAAPQTALFDNILGGSDTIANLDTPIFSLGEISGALCSIENTFCCPVNHGSPKRQKATINSLTMIISHMQPNMAQRDGRYNIETRVRKCLDILERNSVTGGPSRNPACPKNVKTSHVQAKASKLSTPTTTDKAKVSKLCNCKRCSTAKQTKAPKASTILPATQSKTAKACNCNLCTTARQAKGSKATSKPTNSTATQPKNSKPCNCEKCTKANQAVLPKASTKPIAPPPEVSKTCSCNLCTTARQAKVSKTSMASAATQAQVAKPCQCKLCTKDDQPKVQSP